MRKAFAAAFAALVGMSVSAQAADIYEGSLKDEPVYAPAPVWTGLYVGGHIGGLWNDSGDSAGYKKDKDWCEKECVGKWRETSKFIFDDDDDDLSLLGGFHLGYNWQDGSRVYGIEGDLSFADGLDYLASVRARLGHVVDDVLIYGTAGIAFAGFEDKTINAVYKHGNYTHNYSAEFSGDSEVGFVVGGGIERKLSSNVSVGLEGLYYLFDDTDFSKEWYFPYCKKIEHEDDNDLFVVRARLSYHLQDSYEEPLK